MLYIGVRERGERKVSHVSDLSVQEAAPKAATRERDAYLDRSTETEAFFMTHAYRANR